MAADLKRLPLSMPRFSTLRRENRIYVDKTELTTVSLIYDAYIRTKL